MDIFNSIGLLLGTSWASGVNLYLSMAGLGIAHRMEWVQLPGDLEMLSHPLMIGITGVLFFIEFVADKIPLIDSAWDSVHTFIRPIATSLLGYTAVADSGMFIQVLIAILTGTIALEAHLTKATTRAMINTSPEPVSNSVASVAEDASVVGILYLIINHPFIAGVVIVILIVLAIFFLKMMFKFLKNVFKRPGRKQPEEANTLPSNTA